MAALLLACGSRDHSSPSPSADQTATPAAVSATPTPSNVTDQWPGKWIGPEGTLLVLSKNGDKYSVMIQSLDGPATYEGVSNGDRIDFRRNGQKESIHAGNGRETGMKWLLDKKNCLIIKTGEGFCRD